MRMPGWAMYQLSPVALCWVPKRPPPPHMTRTVTGTVNWPPDM